MACAGEQKVGCSDCTKHLMPKGQKRAWSIEQLAEGKLTAKDRGLQLVQLSYLEIASIGLIGLFDPKPGFLNCPVGRGFLGRGCDCKICKKKGRVRCKGCGGKGLGTCPGCSGKGVLNAQCVVCEGSGLEVSFPTLTQGGDSKCGWCKGTMLSACATCATVNPWLATCSDCQGRKTNICKDCSGLRKRGCKGCNGKGISGWPSPNGRGPRCGVCKGKRTESCDSCKRGKTSCTTCQGKGKAKWKCPDCIRKPATACRGCADGQTSYWEAGAKYWESQGVEIQRNQYLDLAIEHKQQYMALFEQACGLAATSLIEEETTKKKNGIGPYRRFGDEMQKRKAWLEEHRTQVLLRLDKGLDRLRKLRATN